MNEIAPAAVGALLRGIPTHTRCGRRQPPGAAVGAVLVAGRIVRRRLRRERDRRPTLLLLVRRGVQPNVWIRLRGTAALVALRDCRRGERVVCVGSWLRGRQNVVIAKTVTLERAEA